MTRVATKVFLVETESLQPCVATVACVATGCGQGRKDLCRDRTGQRARRRLAARSIDFPQFSILTKSSKFSVATKNSLSR